ncbi:MAG: MFS transporter, partial [Microbacteriaceae bacterium]|nr:MFS transporter [Microbacteriaceae bacterium]
MTGATLRYLPVAAALLAIQLDFFDLNLAIPRIAEEFRVPVTDLQWLVSGYMLSLGAMFIPAAKIGDLQGRKRAVLAGAAIFGAMSLASGLAPNAPLL